MVDPGDSGIDRKLLQRFLERLPELESTGLFTERFTLELRTRGAKQLLHVNRKRGVVRPVVAEDSRKRLISMPLSLFERLVKRSRPSCWTRARRSGTLRVS